MTNFKQIVKIYDIVNGTHQVFMADENIGQISKGCVRGEWWVEPVNRSKAELIIGKNNAINFLIKQL
jgi:hypothetical protein